jgi:hypothetical protein
MMRKNQEPKIQVSKVIPYISRPVIKGITYYLHILNKSFAPKIEYLQVLGTIEKRN